MSAETEARWTAVAEKQLVGRKIVSVRYLSVAEAEALDWHNRPIVIQLDDGNLIYPSQDDEGNGGGALFTNNEANNVIPTLR